MDELEAKIAAEIYWAGRFMEGDKYAIARRILALPEIRDALDVRRSTMRAQGYDADC